MRPEWGSKSFTAMSLVANTSVAIYAGGKSSRFGSPKIKAKIGTDEFGLRIIKTLRRAGLQNISLIGGDEDDARRWGVDFHEDVYPDSGPLGALLTALQMCKTERLMTLPCDVPFIDEDTCRRLSNLAPGVEVLVAHTDTPQWLCSTWRHSTYAAIESEFKSGERAIHRVVEKLKFEFVDVSSEILLNVNEPNKLKPQPKTN
jgi:molybdopterin-guanine dinucleotide biosynthesis protein A